MQNHRASGILLHPTSLPGSFGSGDFGAGAFQFIDWLKRSCQTYWQMLPLGEVGPGNSPYMSCSAFAGNVLLIDLVDLAKQGWLSQEDLFPHPDFDDHHIDFGTVVPFRINRLKRAATRFFANRDDPLHANYLAYCKAEHAWLHDYALFKTIEQHQGGCVWSHWPVDLAQRTPESLDRINIGFSSDIAFWKFCQWNFSRQWSMLREYAHKNGVRIVGDVPIFVAYQSADVWANQDLFNLDETGKPTVVAGVPPDYFSATGQLWGNPLYRWDTHEKTGYAWWTARLGHALQQFDLVRIDHFRGFSEYWEVPADALTAIDGKWMPGPGAKLFEAFKQAFGHLPIIAEDLGLITPDVIELRDQFDLPGMRILQFAFGDGETNYFLPHHYIANTFAYTGTHDNDTTLGWWQTSGDHEKDFARHYLHSDGTAIHHDMIKALLESAANTVIFPMQDILGLDGAHRMNFPGLAKGNWEWRFIWNQIDADYVSTFSNITAEHGRFDN